ncbi:MAG: hypothetical protein ACRCYR_00965 [Phycicoccus sp.]
MSDRHDPADRDLLAERLRALGDHGRDLAVLVPVDEVHAGGDRRRRNRRRATAGAALVVLTVAGSLALGSITGRETALDTLPATDTPSASATTSPSTSPGPTSTASPTSTSTPSGTPDPEVPTVDTTVTAPYPGARIGIGAATVVVPDGWSAEPYRGPGAGDDATCLTDPDVRRPPWLDCDLLIQHGGRLVGAAGAPWTSHQRSGWSTSARLPLCPFESEVDRRVVAENGGTPHGSFGAVGSRLAEVSSYDVSCPGTSWAFEPRVWWVRDQDLLVTDVLAHDRTVDILGSIRFADESDAAPLRYVHAKLLNRTTMTTPGPLLLQPIRRLVDDPRGFAWAQSEGRPFPFPSGWVAVDDGAELELTLTAKTSCFAYVNGTSSTYGPERSCRDFLEGGDAVVDVVATEGGEVLTVVARFRGAS